MASSDIVPKFKSFQEGKLTTNDAKKYYHQLIEKMHAMAMSAAPFQDKPHIFNSIHDEYKKLTALSFTHLHAFQFIEHS